MLVLEKFRFTIRIFSSLFQVKTNLSDRILVALEL